MSSIAEGLPDDITLRLQIDSTEELRNQFDDLAQQALISGCLVFLIVLLFIRKLMPLW